MQESQNASFRDVSHQFRRIYSAQSRAFNAWCLLPRICGPSFANPRLQGLGGLAFSSQELPSAVTSGVTGRAGAGSVSTGHVMGCSLTAALWFLTFGVLQLDLMFGFWEASQQLTYDLAGAAALPPFNGPNLGSANELADGFGKHRPKSLNP